LFANADGFVGFVGFDGFVALGIAKDHLQLAVRLDSGPIARLYSALVNLEFSQ
jgi:hypothetical protein